MSRRKEGRKFRSEYAWFYNLLLYLTVLVIGIIVGAIIFSTREGYDINVWTEALGVAAGAGVTVFMLDRMNTRRERLSLQRRLIREAGSRSNDIAISAVEWLRAEGWLKGTDGLLRVRTCLMPILRTRVWVVLILKRHN